MNKSLVKNVCAMSIFGTISIFVKQIDISSAEIALWRAVIAVAVLCVYKLIRREQLPLKIGGAGTIRLAVSGVLVGLNWILLFEAYKYTSVSVATLSYYFAPVLIMIISPLVFHEKMSVKQVAFFVLSTLGLVLIIGARPSGSEDELIGVLLGLAAAVTYAIVVMLNKKVQGVGGIDKTMIQFSAAALVLAVYVPLTSGIQVGSLGSTPLLCLLVLGVIHTGIAYCLYFGSIDKLPGQQVAMLSYIDPLVAVVISILVLREAVMPLQLVGGAMILGFTLLNELGSKKATAKTSD